MRIGFLPAMLGMIAFSGCQQNEVSFSRRIYNKQSPTELLEVVQEVHSARNLGEAQRLELYVAAALKGKNSFEFYANPSRQRRQELALLSLVSEIGSECDKTVKKMGATGDRYLVQSALEEAAGYLIVAMECSFSQRFLVDAGNQLIGLALTAERLPPSPGLEGVEDRIIYPALDKLVKKPHESRPELLAFKTKYELLRIKQNKQRETASALAPSSSEASDALRESKN